MRLLVTRPQADAARTARALAVLGHVAHVDPMLRIVPLPAPPPDRVPDAVAITSANAPAALPADWIAALRGAPAYVVGARTAEAAGNAGFAPVVVADGDVDGLARRLARDLAPGARILWLAGEDRAGDLPTLLAPAGLAVDLRVVYRAAPADRLAPATAALLRDDGLDGALHYSRRTAETLLAAAERDGLHATLVKLRHHALSPQVAEPLVAAGAAVVVARRPDEASLLALLGD